MEADWQEIARIPFPPSGIHAAPTPATCLAFDTAQELLWTGNNLGRVTSFHGSELQRYTSYRGNNQQEGPVKQILLCDRGVLSVAAGSVHLSIRRGLNQWHLVRNEFRDLRCICFSGRGQAEVLVAGGQETMFEIDANKGEVLQTIQAPEHYSLLRRSGQYICAATLTGSVQLLDVKTFSVLKTWKAHVGWINDMDANSSFLVTCGWSPRQQFGQSLDPLVKVFDLKTLMPLPPVPFHSGAAFVRMHPRMLTTAIIASQYGQLQLVDIMNSSMVNFHQLNLVDSYLLGLEIASSGEALAAADSACTIQLWGSPVKCNFTNYSKPTEFASSQPPETPHVDWNGTTPLNVIGMPYYRETLFSAWPSHLIAEVGAPPVPIDPSITKNLRQTEFGAWAPNPRKTLRNQIPERRMPERTVSQELGPKFLSEQTKEENPTEPVRRMSDILEAMSEGVVPGNLKIDVPLMYRNVEIKYSKFGVEDFDFEFYNKTEYSGLETHIANSYLNSLLQIMKFTPWIRNLALHHTATPCLFETCLLCEMGFLFDMLEKAEGQNCQATNLLKTFSGLSHTASLGLLEEGSSARHLTSIVQSANRFLLEKIAADFRQMAPQASHMDTALTTAAISSIRCAHCANETARPGGTYVHELVYPPAPKNKQHSRNFSPTFSQVLKASVERQDQTRGWCDRCKRYQQLHARKTIRTVPPVLMINAAVHGTDAKSLWSKPKWLPQDIGIIVDQGQFFCYEGQDLKMHVQRGVFPIMEYELIGVVCDIDGGSHQKSHLVSVVNVAPSKRTKNAENDWYLFNDFLVRKVSGEEALRFDSTWKLPSVLAFQRKTARHHIDDSWRENLDTSLLYRKWSLQQDENPTRFLTLSPTTEKPQPGTPVGIDAEFVALQQEELEIKADGSRSTLRPSKLALARVSVLRGGTSGSPASSSDSSESDPSTPEQDESPSTHPESFISPSTTAKSNQYIPFIDDYIAIPDPIIDYLTAYSGISPGDLDPRTSAHASTGRLVSLKTAYKKVWLLLNLGCIFVGHGLLKDFRTINIHIPKAQVVDTVDLYHLKSRTQRKLSLRFLSWLLLGEEVQGGGAGHDSVEDARMALKLWRKYQSFEAEDRVDEVLREIYRRGREVGYKVPERNGKVVPAKTFFAPQTAAALVAAAAGGAGAGAAGAAAGAAAGVVPGMPVSGGSGAALSDAGSEGEVTPAGTPKGKTAGLVRPKDVVDKEEEK